MMVGGAEGVLDGEGHVGALREELVGLEVLPQRLRDGRRVAGHEVEVRRGGGHGVRGVEGRRRARVAAGGEQRGGVARVAHVGGEDWRRGHAGGGGLLPEIAGRGHGGGLGPGAFVRDGGGGRPAVGVAVGGVVVVELGLVGGLKGLVDFHLLVALAGRFLELLFEDFVAEDGEEEGVDHFGDEPDFRDFFQGVHADSHALLSG